MCAWPTASARTKNWGTEVLTDTDLEAQLDLLHTYLNDSLAGTAGHDHSGGTNDGTKITLTAADGVTGVLPVANGGTGQSTLATFLNLIYPVGSLYFNCAVATDPATLLGFGTWAAYAAGKMIIGLNSADADFDALTDTGGAKTATLTTTELPAHTHDVDASDATAGSGSKVALHGNASNTAVISAAAKTNGTGSAFSIMNPYVVCYVWKRTA